MKHNPPNLQSIEVYSMLEMHKIVLELELTLADDLRSNHECLLFVGSSAVPMVMVSWELRLALEQRAARQQQNMLVGSLLGKFHSYRNPVKWV